MAQPHTFEITELPSGLLEQAFPHAGELTVNPDRLGFVSSIGFVAVRSESEPETAANAGTIRLLGVYTPSAAPPTAPESRLIVPSQLSDIDPEFITADRIGKGVLGRFWNNEKASRGWIDDPVQRGLYAFDVDTARIHFATEPFSGGFMQTLNRIIEHKTVRDIVARDTEEASQAELRAWYASKRGCYGDIQALFMTEPPQPKVRRLLRGAWGVPKLMGASFIAPLNNGAQAELVGVIKR